MRRCLGLQLKRKHAGQRMGAIFLLGGIALLITGFTTDNSGLLGVGIGLLTLGAVLRWSPARKQNKDGRA